MVKKISDTAVGSVSPVVAYSGSAEALTIAPHKVKTIKSNVVGSDFFSSASLYIDDLDPEDVIGDPKKVTDDPSEKPSDIPAKKAPSLMDIELVSNSIVYDATGTPSVTVVFKVRNSSGQTVKSVNARVKVV